MPLRKGRLNCCCSHGMCELKWNAMKRHTFANQGNNFTKLDNGGALSF